MKKALAGIVALSAVGTSFTGQAEATSATSAPKTETAVSAKYTVNADALRVRTGPGTTNAVLGIVSNGQALQVIGEEQGWYKIEYSGKTAYVSKEYVKSETIQHTVTVPSLRVRTGPGTTFPSIGAASQGQALQILGEVKDWYKIQYNGQTAYVSKNYVSGGSEASVPQTTLQAVNTNGTYTVTASVLRVRTGPDTTYGVIGGVLEGTALTVLGEQNGWYKVRHKNTTGFVSKQHVSFTAGAAKAAATKTYYVTSGALNVRSSASTSGQILGTLTKGAKVEAAEENGWLRISYKGSTGYIAKQYTSQTAPASTTTATTTTTTAAPSVANLVNYAKSLLGTPYLWAGTTPKGFDCSGFIYHVYSKSGYSFSRMATSSYWSSLQKTSNPQVGDLIYFQNTYKPGASHMGVYLGNGSFIHASDGGVKISSTSSSYWSEHFLGYTKPY